MWSSQPAAPPVYGQGEECKRIPPHLFCSRKERSALSKSSDTKPWERQEKEGEKPFEAFVKYRDMGEKRTLNAVAAELQKSYTLIVRWKKTWNWEERVRAYDNDLQKEAHKKAVREKKNMVDRQIKLATLMQDKAMEALEKLDTNDMDPRALVALIREGTSLERTSREEAVLQAAPATENGAGPGGGSLADMITAAWERRKNGEHT